MKASEKVKKKRKGKRQKKKEEEKNGSLLALAYAIAMRQGKLVCLATCDRVAARAAVPCGLRN